MHRPREISTTGELEILAPLSVGGMGEVYLARRRGAHGFSKLIALKTIRPDLLQHEEMRRMFLDEANLLARLDHPAVAQVYDFVEKDGGLYLSMEYVPGVPISKLMQKRQTPVPGPIVARIGVEVCRGLHAAHELTDLDGSLLGVVHRDISPQNVMLTFDGRVKILDFGVAFMFEREATTTQTGLFKGKLAYIAPEQIAGKGADRRSDVYSLAVVMHELLTGRRLFSKGKGALADATNRKRVPKPSTVAPDVPRELEEIVMKGLKGQQRSRFPDAKEMAAALESYLHSAGGESLEAFAERELEDDKEHHRGWIQTVMESPTGPTSATQRDETKPDRPISRTGGPPPLPEKSVEIPITPPLIMESELGSYVPEKPRRSGRLIGLAIIVAALTAGAWLLFPSKVEQNASRFANWASDEARPMITNALEDGAEAFDDDPEIDRTEQERIEEADPDAVEVVEETADQSADQPTEQPQLPPEVLTPTQAAQLVGEKIVEPIAETPPPSGETPPTALVETPPIPKIVTPPPEKRAVPKRTIQRRARPKPPTKMLYGSLSIDARPGGTIVVDGKRVGNTPLNRVRMKPGRHRVALMRGREPKPRWASTVWVREGRHVLIKLK